MIKNILANNHNFSNLEADYLLLGHTLETESDSHFIDYRLDSHFEGFTLVEATLQKGVKNAIWSYTEHDYTI